MVRAVQLNDLLKELDLSRADSRAGLGALLREIHEQPDVGADNGPAAPPVGQGGDTRVYNAVASAVLDDVGVACGV